MPATPPLRKLQKIVLGFFAIALLLFGITFVVDWAVLRVRILGNWQPYGSVTVRHYYAVAQKNNKVQFIFDPPQPWTCVHSLYPHVGYFPCWYLSHHPEQRTDL